MGSINQGRFTANIDGDFVVFIIGAKPNPLRLIRSLRDLGGNRGMKHMLDYLSDQPEKGLLGYEMNFPTIVQYWRSFEQLEAFAKDEDDPSPGRILRSWILVGQERGRAVGDDDEFIGALGFNHGAFLFWRMAGARHLLFLQ